MAGAREVFWDAGTPAGVTRGQWKLGAGQAWKRLKINSFAYFCSKMHVCLKVNRYPQLGILHPTHWGLCSITVLGLRVLTAQSMLIALKVAILSFELDVPFLSPIWPKWESLYMFCISHQGQFWVFLTACFHLSFMWLLLNAPWKIHLTCLHSLEWGLGRAVAKSHLEQSCPLKGMLGVLSPEDLSPYTLVGGMEKRWHPGWCYWEDGSQSGSRSFPPF